MGVEPEDFHRKTSQDSICRRRHRLGVPQPLHDDLDSEQCARRPRSRPNGSCRFGRPFPASRRGGWDSCSNGPGAKHPETCFSTPFQRCPRRRSRIFRLDQPNLDVFHCGILFHRGDRIIMRHAARSRGQVVEQDLVGFLGANRMTGVILVRPEACARKVA